MKAEAACDAVEGVRISSRWRWPRGKHGVERGSNDKNPRIRRGSEVEPSGLEPLTSWVRLLRDPIAGVYSTRLRDLR